MARVALRDSREVGVVPFGPLQIDSAQDVQQGMRSAVKPVRDVFGRQSAELVVRVEARERQRAPRPRLEALLGLRDEVEVVGEVRERVVEHQKRSRRVLRGRHAGSKPPQVGQHRSRRPRSSRHLDAPEPTRGRGERTHALADDDIVEPARRPRHRGRSVVRLAEGRESQARGNLAAVTEVRYVAGAICLGVGILAGCASAPADTPDEAPEIVRLAVEHHGEFGPADTLRFVKTTVLLESDGEVERSARERHTVWESGGSAVDLTDTTRRLRYDLAVASGTWSAAADERLSAGRAAHFTATLPWRLRDGTARLSAVASPDLRLGAEYGVRADYEGGGDAWVHYFAADGQHLGYFVDQGGEDALVVNDSLVVVGSHRLPAHRTSYRVRDGEIAFVRGTFAYAYGE